MRRFVIAACVAGLAIALSSGTAASAWASTTIVVGPGQSIQAAVNAASPGDTVFVKPGVYHQSVQIRTDGITLRGSGAFPGGTVLVPPKSFPKTMCNGAFGPTGVCIVAKNVNPKTGAVITPVNPDLSSGLMAGAEGRLAPVCGTILASGYDNGPAAGPVAGVSTGPGGCPSWVAGTVLPGQGACGSASIRCHAVVIASAHGQVAWIFRRRFRPPRTSRAAACSTR